MGQPEVTELVHRLDQQLHEAVPDPASDHATEPLLVAGRRSLARRRAGLAAVGVGVVALAGVLAPGFVQTGNEKDVVPAPAASSTPAPSTVEPSKPEKQTDGFDPVLEDGAAFVRGKLVVHPDATLLDRVDLTTPAGDRAAALSLRREGKVRWLLVMKGDPSYVVTDEGGDPEMTLEEWAHEATQVIPDGVGTR